MLATVLLALAMAGCMGYDDIQARSITPLNYPPVIESVDPQGQGVFITLRVGQSQTFRVLSVNDPDDTFFGYRWELDQLNEGNGTNYRFTASQVGRFSLVVTVWDCHGVSAANHYAGLNECKDAPPDPGSIATYSWPIIVEP